MIKRFILPVLLTAFFAYHTLAQSKRANIWYQSFGTGFNFNCNPPCPIESPALQACFSTATICDKNGYLQFYSDNETIWNNNHQVMDNGTNLFGCKWSSQGCLIVPFTNNPNLYYLIVCDNYRYPQNVYTPAHTCTDIYPVENILSLNIIDMSANNGKGSVVTKNQIIYGSGRVMSMLAAVKHANTKDTWLMTFDTNTNQFVSLLLTDCGIQDTIITPCPDIIFTGVNLITFSPKGDLFVVNNGYNGPAQTNNMVAHFNTSTGEISNPYYFNQTIFKACFSTDSKYLYTMAQNCKIPRYDVSIQDTSLIYSNRTVINTDTVDGGFSDGMQNGPDGKLYINFDQIYYPTWCIIINPLEENPTLSKERPTISKPHIYPNFATPPNFVQSWFDPNFKEYEYGSPSISYERICKGNKTTLLAKGIPPATPWHWEVTEDNQPASYYYNEDTIQHLFTNSGLKTVRLVIDFSCNPDIITKNDVIVDDLPIQDYIQDTIMCEGSNVNLYAQPDMVKYEWNTGNTQQQQIATINNIYIVTVSNTCGVQKDSATITKIEYTIPNLVTLNHDNMNDVLTIESNTQISGKLEIYDSWGSRIYYNNEYKNTWPEKIIYSGVYYYRFKLSSCKSSNGWVQVLTE